MTRELLEVHSLKTYFKTDNGIVPSVNGVSFSVSSGETLAIVGESGCGKSVTSLSIMGLVSPPGEVVDGEIIFDGVDLRKLSPKMMNKYRGNDISMIFQEPMTSLNPVYTIGNQISEVIRQHQKITKKAATKSCLSILKRVGIPNAEDIVNQFPHQLSGGMRQRVMIAMALVCMPKLLIADEPTTALDVTIQAQILSLISILSKEENMGVILITHDLGVVAEMADRVVVMYAGEVVEEANVYDLFERPGHPYTIGLMNSIPVIGEPKEVLDSIEGMVPNLLELPNGCTFHPRCPYAIKDCLTVRPDLIEKYEGHKVRCIRTKELSI
ncbi:ABC transporter ATP-binding protein [Sporosarcina sp. FA9]|uniref:ABC transporter ATP-binding protein n=1 Tax=Sporosarcina sp. FA9 TaxID=3413030 RepID=UPI003F658A89